MAELREALESAVTAAETATETPVVETPVVEAPITDAPTVETSTETPAEGGDTATTETPAPETGATATKPLAKDAKPAAEAKSDVDKVHKVDRPPQSWKKESKEAWDSIPLAVRQEIHRREAQINQTLNDSAQYKGMVDQFNQVVAPYQARIQSLGGNTVGIVNNLLKTEYVLASGTKQQSAAVIANLIKTYDIDVGTLDNILSGQAVTPQAPQAPDIQKLVQQELNQVLGPMRQQQEQAAAAQQRQVVETIESMALNPQYPHFDEVRDEMADLIEIKANRGIYLSLEEAYNMCVGTNPTITKQVNATQQHQQAQKAKLAASSVTGSPATGGSQSNVGDGSLRGAIEAAFGGNRV